MPEEKEVIEVAEVEVKCPCGVCVEAYVKDLIVKSKAEIHSGDKIRIEITREVGK